MNLTEAKTAKAMLEANLDKTSKAINEKQKELAKRLGVELVGAMNLTTEVIRIHPEFVAVKSAYATAQLKLREFNRWYFKTFKKEINAANKIKYAK